MPELGFPPLWCNVFTCEGTAVSGRFSVSMCTDVSMGPSALHWHINAVLCYAGSFCWHTDPWNSIYLLQTLLWSSARWSTSSHMLWVYVCKPPQGYQCRISCRHRYEGSEDNGAALRWPKEGAVKFLVSESSPVTETNVERCWDGGTSGCMWHICIRYMHISCCIKIFWIVSKLVVVMIGLICTCCHYKSEDRIFTVVRTF